ncbi:neuronal PAS domain-containing protein 2-like isoform X3 [Carassius carassius]|uniref:neuronal PAS domain-containing protein 2-like isoform X3 n=1 Tax=Carassius carassius TaxID=217509 RepID=UPI0028693AF9|nr:neuronal PAS domain-containing protein 2-like isoform X3 [Carassius carassius]
MGEGVSMDNLSEFGGLCPSTRREWDTGSCVDDLMDEDEKDRAKRASRNKSEKKRRDQFNVLIKELCTMLQGQGHPRKMDKSTILQRTIDFLQKQKEITAQTESCEVRQDWKPSFLSNEEFTQLMLEALDGFLIALTTDGNIIYVSDSVSSLIGHLPSDMVDQNILNFLPEREHGEVYKLLSSHMLLTEPSALDLLSSNEMHVEFCCHVARGNIDPKEPPTYEYVKFVGDFKFHNNAVPLSSCNGYELAFPRTLQSSLEEQICLIATVRLVTPQFLKDLCNVEDVCDEFTSRHSLEWKFLFLDHRASPIIGYLPFEVLGTSGYDYYHVDDLELISQCHKQLMQCGKGKSCYYRFLTKGQQWIWLQTHYYITYHQWNSKPEFIVCTHSVVSYAEVRAERRREFGLEESSSDMATSSIKGQEVFLDMCPPLDATRERISSARSVSSQSSRKSSHTALSDSASNSSVRFTEACTSSRQSVSIGPEKSTSRMPHSGSKALIQRQSSSEPTSLSPSCSQHSTMTQSLYGFQQPQLGVMHQLKEQLEERTRILQADIKTQQQELHDIKEKLQLANIQMLLQQPIQGEFSSSGLQQQGPGRLSQHSTHPKPQHCVSHSSRTLLREQPSSSSAQGQQRLVQTGHMQAISVPMQTHTSLTTPFYSNPMMFSPNHGHRTQTDTNSQRNTHTDYSQDGQLRMLLNQPMQMLVPDSSGGSQASQCSSTIQQTKYPLDQQMMPPSFPVQQATPTYTPHPSAAPHLPLQQPQQFFQMQPQGLIHSAPTQALFHTTSIPQQSTVGYIQPQQQQHHHSQSGNLSDYRNMLTR